MSFFKFILSLGLALTLFTGCGSSSNGSSTSTETEEGTNNESSTDQEHKEGEHVNKIVFTASATSTPLGGLRQIVRYDDEAQVLDVLIPFPMLAELGVELEGALPNIPNITYKVSPEDRAIVLSIPVSDYIELTKNPRALPDGRPLPGVNGGEPPSYAFPLPFSDLNAYGYASLDSFSIFIEADLRFPVEFGVNVPLRRPDGSNIGSLRWLPAVPSMGYKNGAFVSFRLPKELSVLIASAQ